MILLNVPYAEKDAAKQLGARWDAEQKKWYVPAGVLATLFAKWMPGGVPATKLLGKKSKGRGVGSPARRSKRLDASGGRIVVGVNYMPMEGAIGPPWDA